MKLGTKLLAATAMMIAGSVTLAQAENLRILTWGSYAPEELVKKFEAENPDIKVEVTFSNNEEMIAKLRATGGTGLGLRLKRPLQGDPVHWRCPVDRDLLTVLMAEHLSAAQDVMLQRR